MIADCASCRHPFRMQRVVASPIMLPAVARCDGALSVCVGCLWEGALARGTSHLAECVIARKPFCDGVPGPAQ